MQNLGRHFRLQLPRVEGQLLSAEAAGGQDAGVLRAAFSTVEINYTFYRMPNTKTLAGWDRDTPPGFRLTLKAPKRITHVAKAARLRRAAAVLPRDRRDPRAQARRDTLPAAALVPQGSRGARRVPGAAAGADVRGVRVPPCLMDGRGGVCAAARAQRRAVRRRQREILHPGGDHRRATLTSGCATRATRPRTCALGAGDPSTPAAAATCTSTSSTRKPATGRSSPGCCSLPSAYRGHAQQLHAITRRVCLSGQCGAAWQYAENLPAMRATYRGIRADRPRTTGETQ